ncbi:MAG TPA: contractile injection system protein, VgrG/Pvc8 family [Solirubrobacteraceae bacterium]|jgi:phage protein D
MTNPRAVPDFALAVGGGPAPAALRASVTGVSLQASLNAASRVEVSLANESLRWLDHPLLAVHNALELSLGYRPDPLPRLFVGEIVSHAASFPSTGAPTLTVAAQDRMTSLQQGTKARWFAIPIPSVGNMPLPDLAVGGIVSLEHALVPIFDPVGAALSVVLGGAEAIAALDDTGSMQRVIRKQHGESDFAFLQRISRENGWEMVVDHDGALGGHQLRFLSPLDHLSPDLTLVYGRSLVDFTPRLSEVGQIVSVTMHVWVARIKTRFAVRVGWDWDQAQLTIDISPTALPAGKGASDVRIDEPVTPSSAPRRILAELIPRLNERLTGSGSTVGDPRISPGTVLKLEGLGVQFSGLYRVTSVTHSLDAGGYRTSFQARKDVWFASIPLPAQGAVPVRVGVA